MDEKKLLFWVKQSGLVLLAEIMRERQQLAQSKSVSELSQMKSISDFPIPTTIEHLIQQAKALKEAKQEET